MAFDTIKCSMVDGMVFRNQKVQLNCHHAFIGNVIGITNAYIVCFIFHHGCQWCSAPICLCNSKLSCMIANVVFSSCEIHTVARIY